MIVGSVSQAHHQTPSEMKELFGESNIELSEEVDQEEAKESFKNTMMEMVSPCLHDGYAAVTGLCGNSFAFPKGQPKQACANKPLFEVTDLCLHATSGSNNLCSTSKVHIMKAFDATSQTAMDEYEREVALLTLCGGVKQSLCPRLLDYGTAYEGMPELVYQL